MMYVASQMMSMGMSGDPSGLLSHTRRKPTTDHVSALGTVWLPGTWAHMYSLARLPSWCIVLTPTPAPTCRKRCDLLKRPPAPSVPTQRSNSTSAMKPGVTHGLHISKSIQAGLGALSSPRVMPRVHCGSSGVSRACCMRSPVLETWSSSMLST